MPNRNLNSDELAKANSLLSNLREQLKSLAAGDAELLFAYRRKIAKELQYDERGKPGLRRVVKARKIGEQGGKCAKCGELLPEKGAVLDRLTAMPGYTLENTRVLCPHCDAEIQKERGYQ